MNIVRMEIPDMIVVYPHVLGDERVFFLKFPANDLEGKCLQDAEVFEYGDGL